jgi:hypothetical protein
LPAAVSADPSAALEERILVEALGELGGTAGGLGGLFGGGLAGALGGRSGGRRGAESAARRLKVDRGQESLELTNDPGDALPAVRAVLGSHGQILEHDEIPTAPPQVWALVGAGAGGLNPAVVRVIVEVREGGGSRLLIRAVAKEGLIKQRAGQKSAAWARQELSRASSAPG